MMGGGRRRPEEREVIRSLEVRCNSLEMELAALRMRKSAGGRGGKREEKKGGEVDSKNRSRQLIGLAAMQGRIRYGQTTSMPALLLRGRLMMSEWGWSGAERSQKVVSEVEEMQRHLKMVRAGMEEASNSSSRPVYDDKVSIIPPPRHRHS